MRKSLGENTNGIKYLSFPVNNEIFAENSFIHRKTVGRAGRKYCCGSACREYHPYFQQSV